MSTPFYDLASLVVVPSGYKSGKVYAQKPMTTDGQLTFTRASTATRVNASGLIEAVASGVPRLDYLNSSCPRLLLEPQRSNVITFSENFDNAGWTKRNATVTANATTAPDGTTSADKIIEDTQNQFHFINSNSGTFAAGSYSFSVFAKSSERNILQLFFNGSANSNAFANFNLQNGTVSLSASCTPSIESYGNGWYRCTIVATVSVSTVPLAYLCLQNSATASRAATYAGNGTSGLFVWGAQVEAGAYATSYIPTLGTSVTRVADDCVKSSATSIIGQTEGVIYINWDYQNRGSSLGNIPICLDAGNGNEVYFYVQSNGNYECEMFVSSVRQFLFTGSLGSFGTKKIAIAYKQNDFALYINGVQIGTDTSGSVPAMNRLYVGRFYGNTNANIASGISEVLLFKTRLTNAQLAELTTL